MTGIPCLDVSGTVGLRVDSASGSIDDDNGLALGHNGLYQLSLGLGEPQIQLIAGGELVSGVALFALDAGVQSDAKHHDI